MKQDAFRLLMLKDLEGLGCCPPPAVFTYEGQPRPLKIGIYDDVLARYPDVDPVRFSRWLRLWTKRHSYLRAICFGSERFDLDDNPAGNISNGEREHARRIIVANSRTLPPRRKTQGVSGRPILSLPSSLQRSA